MISFIFDLFGLGELAKPALLGSFGSLNLIATRRTVGGTSSEVWSLN